MRRDGIERGRGRLGKEGGRKGARDTYLGKERRKRLREWKGTRAVR